MTEADALINGHHQIRNDPVLNQRPIRRVDTDEQRALSLIPERCQSFKVPFQSRPGSDHVDLAIGAGTKQLRHIVITQQHRQAVLQALLNERRLRVEFAIVKTQMDFIDQPIANLRVVVIGQQHLGRQGKKRREQVRMIGSVKQLDPRVFQPLTLIEQLHHQRKQRAIEDVHVQALQSRPLKQHTGQITETGAIDVQLRLVRQAGRLNLRFLEAIVTTGELDAVDAQRRA
ncbi:hypothetical protein D3C72_1243830 [compost metagenome]